jgi:hypothetical protein
MKANAIIITKNQHDHQHLFGLFVNADKLTEDESIGSYGAFSIKSNSEDLEDVPEILEKFWAIYAGGLSVEEVGLKVDDGNVESSRVMPWEDGSGGILEDSHIPFKKEAWMTCYFLKKDDPVPEGMYMPEPEEPAPETDEFLNDNEIQHDAD